MLSTHESLSERVDNALHQNPYLFGKRLRFEADGSHVVLRGTVRSFFQKQMAQEAIRKVAGVETIENHLDVADV